MTKNCNLTVAFVAYAAVVQKCASFGLHSHPSNGKHRVHDVSMSSSLSSSHSSDDPDMNNRRDFFKLTSKNAVKGTGLVLLNTLLSSTPSQALADRDSDGQLDVDSFLKTGGVSQPMGGKFNEEIPISHTTMIHSRLKIISHLYFPTYHKYRDKQENHDLTLGSFLG